MCITFKDRGDSLWRIFDITAWERDHRFLQWFTYNASLKYAAILACLKHPCNCTATYAVQAKLIKHHNTAVNMNRLVAMSAFFYNTGIQPFQKFFYSSVCRTLSSVIYRFWTIPVIDMWLNIFPRRSDAEGSIQVNYRRNISFITTSKQLLHIFTFIFALLHAIFSSVFFYKSFWARESNTHMRHFNADSLKRWNLHIKLTRLYVGIFFGEIPSDCWKNC